MQTHFSLTQLADATVQEADKILRTCVHCGFCTATCPTYLLQGDELDSPRGRIYLMKDMLEHAAERGPTETHVKHIDRCLTCLSCMTTCPSGVHYMHLVDQSRAFIEHHFRRPWGDRAIRAVLGKVMPNPTLFRLSLIAAQPAKLLLPLLRPFAKADLVKRLVALLETARPPAGRTPIDRPGLHSAPAGVLTRKRVALMSGCVQNTLRPDINEATIRLLSRLGVEVMVPPAGCCGALNHHLGQEEAALAKVRANVAAWEKLLDQGCEAILITASGCGTTVKDYGHMLKDDPAWAGRAARVAAAAKDVSEVLETLSFPAPDTPQALRIAYHSACSMQHGQRLKTGPKALLEGAGFTVMDVPEGHICCGSAGTYSLLQPDLSQQLKARKLGNIALTQPQAVATGNIGCLTQLQAGLPVPIIHTVELLDWAYGGPKPAGL